MRIYLLVTIIFSLLFFAEAKPGESYVLTGREKSIFSIFQADMKAYPELYKGADINEYYEEFKTLNNLNGRKLIPGEKLQFPHTSKSKQILKDERVKAARAEEEARAAAARARAKEAAAANPEKSEEELSLFGSDTCSRPGAISAEARQKNARQKAVHYFQHTVLPDWMHMHRHEIIQAGTIDALVAVARAKVDDEFADALVLHRFPETGVYIVEFEQPRNVSEYYFIALKTRVSNEPALYALEKGISFFGAGDESVLFEWWSRGRATKLGGRGYTDLASFRQELEQGRPAHSVAE